MIDILVADDSKAMRIEVMRLVREVVADANFLFAENGAQVLKVWSTDGPPHLTVLDIHMPVFDGLELLRQAAASRLEIPRVIIYTASRDEIIRRQCVEAGATAVITKSRENLQEAVRKALQVESIGVAGAGL